MENPYRSPESNVEIEVTKVPRPRVLYFIAIIFFIIMVVDSILAYLGDQDGEWVLVMLLSTALLYIPWSLINGKSWAISTAITVFTMIAILNIGGFYEESIKYPKLQRNIYIVEGIACLCLALILYRIKNHEFFEK